MAEIKIEKKKPVWPWVLAGIVLVALIIVFFVNDDNDQAVMNTEPVAEVPVTNDAMQDNNAVDAYVQFVQEEQGRMGEDHAYTQQAFHKLTEAVRSLADEKGHDINADLNQAEQHADMITNDPAAENHAQHIREAANAITNALSNMQQAYYPDMNDNAQELREATESIDPQQQTLEQKEAVKSFFDQSAELIQEME